MKLEFSQAFQLLESMFHKVDEVKSFVLKFGLKMKEVFVKFKRWESEPKVNPSFG